MGKIGVIICFLYLSFLMLIITLQYIPLDLQVAFLATKQYIIKRTYYQIAFFSHVYSSMFILLLGAMQFSERIRYRFPIVHRYAGLIYVVAVVCISSPAGFIMGIHGNGGIIAQSSFCLLSVLWFYFTLLAFLAIKKGGIVQHKNFMILSYALTLSALTLRLHKYILTNTTDIHRIEIYRIVSWSGWIVNLAIAYLYIHRHKILKSLTQKAQ